MKLLPLSRQHLLQERHPAIDIITKDSKYGLVQPARRYKLIPEPGDQETGGLPGECGRI